MIRLFPRARVRKTISPSHRAEDPAYLITGRAKHLQGGKINPRGDPLAQTMRATLKRAGYRSRCRLRKQIVEPVFGQIKEAKGFRQFPSKWALICAAHNLTTLARA